MLFSLQLFQKSKSKEPICYNIFDFNRKNIINITIVKVGILIFIH